MVDFKKILSVILCFLLVVWVVYLPVTVTAETDNSYSIFNLKNMKKGTKVEKGIVALPSGAGLEGISTFSSGWQASHTFNGSQEIVETNGKKGWKINFDVAMNTNNNLCDVTNEFMIKVSIPSSVIPYVTGVKADISNASAKSLGISFGFIGGGKVSWLKGLGNSFEAIYNTSSSQISVERNISNLWKRSDLYAGCPSLTEVWETGVAEYVYLVIVSKGCDGSEGGYVIINDISLELSIPTTQLPSEYDVNLLDFTYAQLGSAISGDTAMPTGLLGAERWTPSGCGISDMYSGKQEIVEIDSHKAWKINFNKAAKHNGWLWGSSGLFGFTVSIPAKYLPYMTKINMEVVNGATGSLQYRFGVTDGTHLGTANSDGVYSLSAKDKQKISLEMAALGTYSNAFAATHGAASQGSWLESGYETAKIYVLLSDSAAVESGTGYLIINNVTITCMSGMIPFVAENITGGTLEGNKIKVPVTSSDQTVEIKIPEDTLLQADSLTYRLSSTCESDVKIKLYTNTQTDKGESGYIKMGENPWTYSIPAKTQGNLRSINFYGTNGGSTCVKVFSGSYYLNNWMGNVSTHPSGSEKAKITSIYLGIAGVESPTGYITIEGLTFTNIGVRVICNSVSHGTANVLDKYVKIGESGRFAITPNTGYYLKNLSVKSSSGEILPYDVVSKHGNYGVTYSAVANGGDIVVTPEFAKIDRSIQQTAYYRNNDLVANFSVLLKTGLAYNEETASFETPTDYGMYIVGPEALKKYGYTLEDLTPEFVEELFETGHHLINYIYKLDSENMIKAAENPNLVSFIVEYNNLTLTQKRSPILMATYVRFKDSNGNVSKTVCHFNDDDIDSLVYGENFKSEFTAKKGINFAASLKSDYSVWQDIKNQGFDHVRIPAYLRNCLDENGNIKQKALIDIDTSINYALKAGLCVVLDVHQLPANFFGNYSGSVDTVYKFWKQLASYYSDLPLSVAFEFMNEPNTSISKSDSNPDPISASKLMTAMDNLIKNTRSISGNEDRHLVLSNNYNAAWALAEYTANSYVMNYKNIILDIHYYNPMTFTHSGSTWDLNADGSYKYPAGATSYGTQDIIDTMAKLKNISDTYGVEIWLGEWGALRPDNTAKARYYADVSNTAEQYGIAWCVWEYGGGWSPYKDGVWDETLVDALIN